MGQDKAPQRKTYRQLELPALRRLQLAEETGVDAEMFSPHDNRVPEAEFSRLIENCIGVMPVPLGLAENFRINYRDLLIPMATNEPTVIAAASHAAKLCRDGPTEGFHVQAKWPLMTGQLLYGGFGDRRERDEVRRAIDKWLMAIGAKINGILDRLKDRQRRVDHVCTRTVGADLLVVEFTFEVGQTMGGLSVTKYMRTAAGLIRQLAVPIEPKTVICSNAGAGWLIYAHAVWPMERDRAENILRLQDWSLNDPARMATHRKGVMNGIEAVGLATGQDTRAISAALYEAYAGWPHNPGLTQFSRQFGTDGFKGLLGCFGGYLPVATKGGATQHPVAVAARQFMNVDSGLQPPAGWLAAAMACVGLACNFSALRCLAEEGIAEAFNRVRQDD